MHQPQILVESVENEEQYLESMQRESELREAFEAKERQMLEEIRRLKQDNTLLKQQLQQSAHQMQQFD